MGWVLLAQPNFTGWRCNAVSVIVDRIIASLKRGYGNLTLTGDPISILDQPGVTIDPRTLPEFDLDVYQDGVFVPLPDEERQALVQEILDEKVRRDSQNDPIIGEGPP